MQWFQVNKDRLYPAVGVRLRKAVVDKLQRWNSFYPNTQRDGRFVKLLMIEAFSLMVLRKSSLTGDRAKNSAVCYNKLRPDKVDFVQALYNLRVKTDVHRRCLFNRYVEKICRNARKN